MKPVSIITPTGDRPEALTLLSKYIERQDYPEPIQWIVVDDGNTPFEPPQPNNAELTYVRRTPSSKSVESLPANIRLGLTHVKHPWIAVLEDDDWYGESYLSKLLPHLEDNDLVGERQSLYYNIRHRVYRQLNNHKHASLCCTAFTKEMVPYITRATKGDHFVDKRIWNLSVKKRKLIPPTQQQMGIKGTPGRYGLGMGHAPNLETWNTDHDWEVLVHRVGHEDAEQYKKWYRYNFPELFQHAVVPIARGKPWLVIGKGPSFSRVTPEHLTKYHTIGLNHVCTQFPVDFAHMIDWDVVEDLGETLETNARFVILPWFPHVEHTVSNASILRRINGHPVLEKMTGQGRVLTYFHSPAERFGERPEMCPLVPVKYTSFEPVIWLLSQLGVKEVWTAGIDNGSDYAEPFQHLLSKQGDRKNVHKQMRAVSKSGVSIRPLEPHDDL